MKWFGLMLISIVGWFIAIPFMPMQLLYRAFSRKYDIPYYCHQIAVGNDVMVGSMIYGSKHTVSAITGHKSHQGDSWHKFQENIIDFFFGQGHCRREAIDENLIKETK